MATESFERPGHKKGDKADALKYTGTSSWIQRGGPEAPFGRGTAGAVAQETITVTHGGDQREVTLAAKSFKRKEGPDSLEASTNAYRLLKEAGVKHIPTTYRRLGEQVLMTNYNHAGRVAISCNQNEKAAGVRIDSIENLPQVLEALDADIQVATTNGLFIPSDSYFFLIPKIGERVPLDFVIGDLGGIRLEPHFQHILNRLNTREAKSALAYVLDLLPEKEKAECERQVHEWAEIQERIPLKKAA